MTLEKDRTSQVGLRIEHLRPWQGQSQSTPTVGRSCTLPRRTAKISANHDVEFYAL